MWLACTLSFILGLPSLGSSVAFSAATSIATIGLYISYGIPIALRVAYAPRFVRGPFHLGAFSFPVASAAVLWICFITIAFVLPEENPVDSQTLNYAVVAVGIVVAYSLGFWVVSARKWFTGPVKQIAGACVSFWGRWRALTLGCSGGGRGGCYGPLGGGDCRRRGEGKRWKGFDIRVWSYVYFPPFFDCMS